MQAGVQVVTAGSGIVHAKCRPARVYAVEGWFPLEILHSCGSTCRAVKDEARPRYVGLAS